MADDLRESSNVEVVGMPSAIALKGFSVNHPAMSPGPMILPMA